jgi:hypothetical protein
MLTPLRGSRGSVPELGAVVAAIVGLKVGNIAGELA